ncbi:rCG32725 [Rattus norvegicus]|uniref:RCG32725 n=1 Tax=Rattus norvegicus TaxID=10116 RepID=A6HJE9_RAT|nr:rCG32725 [Rattus norvegicus]
MRRAAEKTPLLNCGERKDVLGSPLNAVSGQPSTHPPPAKIKIYIQIKR